MGKTIKHPVQIMLTPVELELLDRVRASDRLRPSRAAYCVAAVRLAIEAARSSDGAQDVEGAASDGGARERRPADTARRRRGRTPNPAGRSGTGAGS